MTRPNDTDKSPFSTVEEAIQDLRDGKMVVILDDEDRENEGDLVCAAEFVTAEIVNFMATHGRGLICLALTPERVDALRLPMMVPTDAADMGTAFTVSIEARVGVTTGISAADRAETIRVASNPDVGPEEIVSPGHVAQVEHQVMLPGRIQLLHRLAKLGGTIGVCQLPGELDDADAPYPPSLDLHGPPLGLSAPCGLPHRQV